MKLRPYQQIAHDAVLRDLQIHDSSLLVLPTGTGKTVLFAHLAQHFARFGRVLVLAHREELIYQARDKVQAVTGSGKAPVSPDFSGATCAGEYPHQRR